MSDNTPRPRRKAAKNTHTTKSGKTITVNRTLGDRMRARREARAQRKAAYLSTLPKEPWKRWLYRMHPKRVARYWFSREGALMALKLTGISLVVIFLVVVGLFAYFRKDLPKIRDINSGDSGGSIAYYARDAQTLLFQDFDAFKRIPVSGTEIAKHMKEATIAFEDKEFYNEGAFNMRGMLRAAVNNATGGSTQGGSTITQQLVKLNEGWSDDHTVSRKVKELILAVELEREYSKDDILTAYLNVVPYGGLDYGVEAAAQDYFGVKAKDLTLAQSALLAGIPQSPGVMSPYTSPQYNPDVTIDNFDRDGLIARQRHILNLMVQQGYITQKEADEAQAVDVMAQIHQRPTSHYAGIKHPYFVQAAREELAETFPASVIKSGGWKVITTLDVGLQELAEKSLQENRYLLDRYKADNAAFVAEDNATGQIVALIGGVDFNNDAYGKVNYATRVNISPGSSIKPYDYATFINNNTNVGAGSVLYDTVGPLPVNGYQCTNKAVPEANKGGNCLWDYDRHSPGPTTLRYALGGSRNIPAVKAMISAVPGDTSVNRTVSINKTISTINGLMHNSHGYRCYNTGVEDFFNVTEADETQCYAASGIGDGAYLHLDDHVNGIASLSRLGKSIPHTYILKVINNSGKVLKEFEQPEATQVLKPDSAYIVNNMAADPGASYLGGSCNATNCSGMKFHRYKGWTNAIKTGTTNYNFDGLMLSWNPKYTAGIWIGNHSRNVAFKTSPENITDPIMKKFMQGAIDQLGNVPAQSWTAPSGIKTSSAFVITKAYGRQTVPSSSTDIYPSWYLGKSSGNSAPTDKVSGKLATNCTPSLARQETGSGGSVGNWNVDIFMGGNPNGTTSSGGTSSQGSDDVHSCSDKAPDVTITAITDKDGNVVSECPADDGCKIMVHVEQGTHPLTSSEHADFPGTLTLVINGQTVKTQQISSSGDYPIAYKPGSDTVGDIDIEVRVTDSVLYQGSDTRSVTIAFVPTARLPYTTSGAGRPNDGSAVFA